MAKTSKNPELSSPNTKLYPRVSEDDELFPCNTKLYPNISNELSASNLRRSPRNLQNVEKLSSSNIRRSPRNLRNAEELSSSNIRWSSHLQEDSIDRKARKNNVRTDTYKENDQSGECDMNLKEHNILHKQTNSLFIVFLVIPIILAILWLMNQSKGNQEENLKINFGNLKSKFKIQSDRTWKILKSSTRHIIASEEPDRPAVIMMVLPNNKSQPMAICLAQHLSHSINKILKGQTTSATSYPFVNSTNFLNYETDIQKLKLDNSIEDLIKYHRSIIITHLEKLPSETVMFFHGLCDTTEAKYKQIAIIFLLETSYEIKNEPELALYLENLWSDIDRIKIKPLLARIANNVIFLNEDESFTNS